MMQANEAVDRSPDVQALALVDALYATVRRAHRLRRLRVHSSCDKAGLVLLAQLVEHGPMRLSDLATAVQLDTSTVSRQVRGLCDGGFAEALDDPADRRARLLRISAAGRAELESVTRELGEVLSRATSRWAARDVDQLTTLLARLADDLTLSNSATAEPNTPLASPAASARGAVGFVKERTR